MGAAWHLVLEEKLSWLIPRRGFGVLGLRRALDVDGGNPIGRLYLRIADRNRRTALHVATGLLAGVEGRAVLDVAPARGLMGLERRAELAHGQFVHSRFLSGGLWGKHDGGETTAAVTA